MSNTTVIERKLENGQIHQAFVQTHYPLSKIGKWIEDRSWWEDAIDQKNQKVVPFYLFNNFLHRNLKGEGVRCPGCDKDITEDRNSGGYFTAYILFLDYKNGSIYCSKKCMPGRPLDFHEQIYGFPEPIVFPDQFKGNIDHEIVWDKFCNAHYGYQLRAYEGKPITQDQIADIYGSGWLTTYSGTMRDKWCLEIRSGKLKYKKGPTGKVIKTYNKADVTRLLSEILTNQPGLPQNPTSEAPENRVNGHQPSPEPVQAKENGLKKPELDFSKIKVCIDPQCEEVAHNVLAKETRCRNCDGKLVKIDQATYFKKFALNPHQVDYLTGQRIKVRVKVDQPPRADTDTSTGDRSESPLGGPQGAVDLSSFTPRGLDAVTLPELKRFLENMIERNHLTQRYTGSYNDEVNRAKLVTLFNIVVHMMRLGAVPAQIPLPPGQADTSDTPVPAAANHNLPPTARHFKRGFKVPGIETYTGGKAGAGVYQALINQIPPHTEFVSGCLGHCAVMRHKQPARVNVGIDKDPDVITLWTHTYMPWLRLVNTSILDYLNSPAFHQIATRNTFLFLDPPYPLKSRKGQRQLYIHEMADPEHLELLKLIKKLQCMVMICTYPDERYREELKDWRLVEYSGETRSGRHTEWVFMNYPQPDRLHDYYHVGKDYRERENIRRKISRWTATLKDLPTHERNAIIDNLQNV